MKKELIGAILSALPLMAFSQTREVVINPTITYQQIDNFTAADAWSGNFVGKYWGEKEKEQVAEWLFSQETDAAGNPKGIGLSLWRVNVGAGSFEQTGADIQPLQRRAESYKTVDGQHYDWGKCQGQEYFMRRAAALGCNNFLLFSNSPLIQYTKNGKGYSSAKDSANIRPECYDAYGDYLAEVADHLMKEGLHVSYISPINEPQVEWVNPTQEGSPWRKSEMKKMFVSLDKALSARQALSGVKILVGEGGNIPVLYQEVPAVSRQFGGSEDAPQQIAQAFFDPSSPNYVGNLKHVPAMVCGHTYHNHAKNAEMREVRSKIKAECDKYGIAYQQTEWCLLPYTPKEMLQFDGFTPDWTPGNRGDIQVALLLGRLVYTDMVCAGAEAWGYWKGMELKGDHSLVALHAKDGNIFNGGTVSSNKILWALGNYSFFIRPGYHRIDVKGADNLDTVAASAYLSPDGKRIVLVFVNSGFNVEELTLSLPATYAKRVKQISTYRTDRHADLAYIGSCADVRGKQHIMPRSLTTYCIDLK